MIKKYTLKAFETALNQALLLDEDSTERLLALEQKSLTVLIKPLNIPIHITFEQGKLRLLPHLEHEPDTTIQSSPLGLIRLSLLPASKTRSLFNDDIEISGDVVLGQDVKALFDECDIDWEGHLASFTGDVVAHQIGQVFRLGQNKLTQFGTSMQQNMTDYLQDELQISPTPIEVAALFDDIDTLILDVDRLEARINQLKAAHEID